MQKIFKERARVSACPPCDWNALTRQAQAFEQLDFPHRWSSGCPELGRWTLAARSALKTGAAIDLRNGLPSSVSVVFAENQSQRNLEYQLSSQDRRQIDAFERAQSSLLILTPYNDTARSFRGLFNRRIPLWEGHTRPGLEKLVNALAAGQGDRAALAAAIVAFMGEVGKGFSPSAFGDRFEREVRDGCRANCRGKPATIQELARFVVAEANHCGVAKMLRRLSELTTTDVNFVDVKIDCHREFWEAIRLSDFDTADNGFAEITHRRDLFAPEAAGEGNQHHPQGEGLGVRERYRHALRRAEFPGQARGKVSPLRCPQPGKESSDAGCFSHQPQSPLYHLKAIAGLFKGLR